MPDEEKPYDPTPSRIRKAKREGNIARSQEISTVASFGGGTIAIFIVGGYIAEVAAAWFGRLATAPESTPDELVTRIAALTFVPILAALVLGVIANIVQAGGVQFIPLKVQVSRMNPKEGLKRMFTTEAVVTAVRALLVFVLAVAATIPTAQIVFTRAAGGGPPAALASLTTDGVARIFATVLALGIASAVIDYIIVRKRWLKKLKMSLYELKKDLQESEGDPRLRGRRRQRHRSMVSGKLGVVKNAAFVVANPTHIAVAMEYRPPEVSVPRVLLMAIDDDALAVREFAAENEIPVVVNVELARTLLETARIGRSIPRETFVAVAEIVAALVPKKVAS
jgi:flagellar biosynthetic protein FlhB